MFLDDKKIFCNDHGNKANKNVSGSQLQRPVWDIILFYEFQIYQSCEPDSRKGNQFFL